MKSILVCTKICQILKNVVNFGEDWSNWFNNDQPILNMQYSIKIGSETLKPIPSELKAKKLDFGPQALSSDDDYVVTMITMIMLASFFSKHLLIVNFT